MKLNEGEVPQYYVENSHPAIIDRNEWEMVQGEMARRKVQSKRHNSLSPFSAKLICGDCGNFYGSKVWHSTDKYRRVIWQCNGKYKGELKCHTPHLTEEEIKSLFSSALDQLLAESSTLLEDCAFMYDTLADATDIETECESLADEMETLSVRIERLITENAATAQDQTEYRAKYENLAKQFESAKSRLEALTDKKKVRFTEAEEIKAFIEILRAGKSVGLEYTDSLWNSLVDHVTIYSDERLVFAFKNGKEITERL